MARGQLNVITEFDSACYVGSLINVQEIKTVFAVISQVGTLVIKIKSVPQIN